MPIATFDEQVWKGSDLITQGVLSLDVTKDNLEKKWQGTDMTMADFCNDKSNWISFTNDKLAALLYPNICRTLADSYAASEYVNQVDSFGWFQKQSIRAIGSLAMFMAASKVKSTYRQMSWFRAVNQTSAKSIILLTRSLPCLAVL